MRIPFLFILLLGLAMLSSSRPTPNNGISVNYDYTVESLVRDVFARGACDNISNIRAIGSKTGIGHFENGSDVIGMREGIIVSSGPITNAEGPNRQGDMSGAFGFNDQDPDLEMFATHRLRDVVGIEFDFVPLDSFVQFRYVFASEEYCEFVGSVYNDVFGFFISGPGIDGAFSDGAKNVALIPESGDYVAINTVNHLQNAQYFRRNELDRDARQCGIDPLAPQDRRQIEYDGFTQILSASLQLIPCETYHIRFVVADVADRNFDSAVFLEAGSFNIGGTVAVAPEVSNGNRATEGCPDAFFVFERGETDNLSSNLSVRFKIAENSTATEGVDFEPIPRSITIPAGKEQVRLPIHFLQDEVSEALEKLTIELDIPCACYSGSATLEVEDPPPLQVTLPAAFVCDNSTTRLTPEITGGTPPYTFQWSNGSAGEHLEVTANGHYAITIADRCGRTASDSSLVMPIEPPGASLNGYAEICAGDTAFFEIELWGEPPWQITYSINGALQPDITNIQTEQFRLAATTTGTYRLLTVTDANCQSEATGSAEVKVNALDISADVQAVQCFDDANGSISITPSGGTPPYDFVWLNRNDQQAQINNLAADTYSLSLTDALGCSQIFDIEVPTPEPLTPVVFTCDNLTDAAFEFSASGGTPPYTYATDGVHFFDHSIFKTLEPGVSYTLTTRDAAGCTLQQDIQMPPVYDQMVTLPPVLELKLNEVYPLRPVLNIPMSLVDSIRWSPPEGLSCADCLEPEIEGLREGDYTVQITDVFGCTGEASVRIQLDRSVDVFIPSAFSPNGDGVNDRLTVFANQRQVRRVVSFRVFDRWGNQVFAKSDFFPNDEQQGWDGKIGAKLANAGLFVYMGEVELVDNTTTQLKGQVMLVR
jgi:gliding motility-associated-like protein